LHIKSIANVDTFESRYEKVADTLLIRSTYLIIGCQTPTVLNFEKSVDAAEMDDPDWLFKNNLFGAPAEGCIDISIPGPLEINVEVSNSDVVVPAIGDDTKTLVGSTQGPIFRLSIER